MKLSQKQRYVLELMAAGWELAHSYDGAWLQEQGIGRGGATFNVHGGTFHSLYNRKLIRQVNDSLIFARQFVLTQAARDFLAAAP